jgi:hypothetical protein
MKGVTPVMLVLLLFLLVAPGVSATTWKVPENFPTIGEAIAGASDGDVIIVWPSPSPDGDYDEQNLDLGVKELVIKSRLGAGRTIIDCTPEYGVPGRGFIIAGGQSRATIIEGFTIREAGAPAGENGAGFKLDNVSPQIRDCRVEDCVAPNDLDPPERYTRGGGLYAYGGAPLVKGCEFYHCEADGGGGMAFEYAIPEIVDNDIHGCVSYAMS